MLWDRQVLIVQVVLWSSLSYVVCGEVCHAMIGLIRGSSDGYLRGEMLIAAFGVHEL